MWPHWVADNINRDYTKADFTYINKTALSRKADHKFENVLQKEIIFSFSSNKINSFFFFFCKIILFCNLRFFVVLSLQKKLQIITLLKRDTMYFKIAKHKTFTCGLSLTFILKHWDAKYDHLITCCDQILEDPFIN